MTHRPSDYAHRYGERPPVHGRPPAGDGAMRDGCFPKGVADGGAESEAGIPGPSADAQPRGGELATFRLLYESRHICVFETREGHLSAVDVNRLA